MDTEYQALKKAGGRSLYTHQELGLVEPPPKPKTLSNGRSRIVAGGLAVAIPMIALPFLLLGLVLARATTDSPSTAASFSFNATDVSNLRNVYYVNINATTLLTISAWSSTLTPILGVLLMELWSYHTASSLRKHSRSSDKMGLPTPYQFALLLDILKGNVGSLLSTLEYGYSWTRRRTATVPLLRASVSMLSVVTFLGLLILLADTWLHLETETVTVSKSLNLGANLNRSDFKAFGLGTDESSTAEDIGQVISGYWGVHQGNSYEGEPNHEGLYGTEVPSSCIHSTQTPCSLPGDNYRYYPYVPLNGQDIVTRFLTNSSTIFQPQILPFRNGSDNGNLTLIAPARIWQTSTVSLDYTAKSYGALTTCKPMTKECGFNKSNSIFRYEPSGWSFNCENVRSTFNRSSPYKHMPSVFENHTIYSDQQYSKPYGWNVAFDDNNGTTLAVIPTLDVVNPSYPAAVIVSQSRPNTGSFGDETVEFEYGGSAMTLFCKHTIMDVNFSFINGTFAIIDGSPSSIATAKITNIPLSFGFLQGYFNNSVDSIMLEATPELRANAYAAAYSLASTAILSGILAPMAVREAQIRRRELVTRVPKAPLFVLIVLNVLYAAIGLALTLNALRAVRKDKDLVDVQARLSVAGLTAECFEDADIAGRRVDSSADLFGEKTGALGRKVGVGRASSASPPVSETAATDAAAADAAAAADETGSERQPMANDLDTSKNIGWRLTRFDVEETPRRRPVNDFWMSNPVKAWDSQ